MGLKSSKKPAMVLILILMIITSLSIFIIGAMKILTSSDEEFSINRNSSGGTATGNLGKFICYKKADGKLYWQRVEYNTDGSIKSRSGGDNISGSDKCIFEIPKGVRNFEITVVGGGGLGASSSREYRYKKISSGSCISANANTILAEKNAKLTNCSNTYQEGIVCRPDSVNYNFSNNKDANLLRFIKKMTGYQTERCTKQCVSYSGARCKKWANICSNTIKCGSGGTPKKPQTSNCKLEFEHGSNTRKISLNQPLYYSSDSSYINNVLVNTLNGNIACEQQNPYYTVNVGLPGSAGGVKINVINNIIYGSNTGGNKITIDKSQIGDGGKGSSGKGGNTTFKYWHKNSKKYIEQSISAEGGNKGSYSQITISSQEQAETIESKEGQAPSSFSIPSIFNFEKQLYAGYYDASKAGHYATYFGASGASGYIDIIPTKLSTTCSKIIIDGVVSKAGCSDPDSGTTSYPNTIAGTNGAGGAILISW